MTQTWTGPADVPGTRIKWHVCFSASGGLHPIIQVSLTILQRLRGERWGEEREQNKFEFEFYQCDEIVCQFKFSSPGSDRRWGCSRHLEQDAVCQSLRRDVLVFRFVEREGGRFRVVEGVGLKVGR